LKSNGRYVFWTDGGRLSSILEKEKEEEGESLGPPSLKERPLISAAGHEEGGRFEGRPRDCVIGRGKRRGGGKRKVLFILHLPLAGRRMTLPSLPFRPRGRKKAAYHRTRERSSTVIQEYLRLGGEKKERGGP